jgi:shikimate dehydrogenase
MNASADNTDDLPIVDGATRLYGIIGDPIAQVKSPEILTARIRAARRNALLLPMHVKPELFDETVHGLKALANLDGIVITVPYKPRIVPFVDQLMPTGERVGAINAMRREPDGTWVGDMFDGKGMLRGLRKQGADPKGLRVMLLGAGGAGSAIADAVADAGAASLAIFDVDKAKAGELAKRIAKFHSGCQATAGEPTVEGIDILINATPIGMAENDPLPMKLGKLDPKFVVADVIVKPGPTPFLKQAEACGCRIVGGRAMIAGQVSELLQFFGIER